MRLVKAISWLLGNIQGSLFVLLEGELVDSVDEVGTGPCSSA